MHLNELLKQLPNQLTLDQPVNAVFKFRPGVYEYDQPLGFGNFIRQHIRIRAIQKVKVIEREPHDLLVAMVSPVFRESVKDDGGLRVNVLLSPFATGDTMLDFHLTAFCFVGGEVVLQEFVLSKRVSIVAPVAADGFRRTLPGGSGKRVFISYNHANKAEARRVKEFLQQRGLSVIMDEEDMLAGQDILEFIQKGIRKADAVISIISGRSLQSAWVASESVAAMHAIWLAEKKFIPVMLEEVRLDADYYKELAIGIRNKIATLDQEIETLREIEEDVETFIEERARLLDLKNNLSQIFAKIRSVLTLDISGANFEPAMQNVLRSIHNE